MENDSERRWQVTYYGVTLDLSTDEYLELKRAVDEDPLKAQRLADEHLTRTPA